MMIERVQKEVAFEEAARQSLVYSDVLAIGTRFQDFFGLRAIGTVRYGTPFTKFAAAVKNQRIDVEAFRRYLEGLRRDAMVLELATQGLEDQLHYLETELDLRLSMLKRGAADAVNQLSAEVSRTNQRGTWSFIDSFESTDYIDASATTAWIDTVEGVAFPPTKTVENHTAPEVKRFSLPSGSSSFSTRPADAIDGNASTSWNVLFSTSAWAELELQFPNTIVTGVRLDPVGFGGDVKITVNDVVKHATVNRITTFDFETTASTVKIEFRPSGSVLPKAFGFREISILRNEPADRAVVRTKTLSPDVLFNEFKVDVEASIPEGSHVVARRSVDGGAFGKFVLNRWIPLYDAVVDEAAFDGSDLIEDRGLYRYDVASVPLNLDEGALVVGVDQVEIAAVPKLTEKDDGFRPSPEEFSGPSVLKTWSSVPYETSEDATVLLMQYSDLSTPPVDRADGHRMYVRRRLGAAYGDSVVLALNGDRSDSPLAFDHVYRFRCHVFCTDDVSVDDGRFWFIQGFRNGSSVDTSKFSEIGRTKGSFSLFVNGTLVAGSDVPTTAYTSSHEGSFLEAGGENGRQYRMVLRRGWNVIDLLLHVKDTDYEIDETPYLQLSLYPSVFDPRFQSDVGIEKVAASGERKPVSEFDLAWNLPRDYAYWAWDVNSPQRLLFNIGGTSSLRKIDGVYSGVYPEMTFRYLSTEAADPTTLAFEFEMASNSNVLTRPRLKSYHVMVR